MKKTLDRAAVAVALCALAGGLSGCGQERAQTADQPRTAESSAAAAPAVSHSTAVETVVPEDLMTNAMARKKTVSMRAVARCSGSIWRHTFLRDQRQPGRREQVVQSVGTGSNEMTTIWIGNMRYVQYVKGGLYRENEMPAPTPTPATAKSTATFVREESRHGRPMRVYQGNMPDLGGGFGSRGVAQIWVDGEGLIRHFEAKHNKNFAGDILDLTYDVDYGQDLRIVAPPPEEIRS